VASLEKQIELFNRAGCKVLVISFGEIKGAASWLSATGCNLEMFLDPERRLYTSLGLPRSVSSLGYDNHALLRWGIGARQRTAKRHQGH